MSDDRIPPGGLPEHALLRERMRQAAEAESVRARAREWRDKTDDERVRAFIEVMWTAAMLMAAREKPYEKPPLNFPRFSSGKRATDAHPR